LNYRKFSSFYSHFTYEGKPEVPDLPVVKLATGVTDITIGQPPRRFAPPLLQKEGNLLVELNSQDALRWNDYGIGLFRQGDFTAAVKAFQHVTEIDPKYADGWVNVARVLIEEGETAEAQKWIDQALQLDPNLGRAHYFRGLALKAAGDYDRALREFQIVESQFPRDRVNLNQIGRILFLKRQYPQAIDWFKRTLAIDPEDVSAHYNLMLCYRGANDAELSSAEEKLYLRFKADEAAQMRTGDYRRNHPIDNNERQPIHIHEGRR
jgi:tetratricopeptide (TPR) repeat protein